MRNFWFGVLVGMIGTMLLCAVFGFAFNVVVGPRVRAASLDGEFRSPLPIVLRGLLPSRGEFGVIDDIKDQTIVLSARDGSKKNIVVTQEADIYRGPTKIALSDLSKGQRIVVIAAAQADGSLKAKLIRVVSSSRLLFFDRRPEG